MIYASKSSIESILIVLDHVNVIIVCKNVAKVSELTLLVVLTLPITPHDQHPFLQMYRS
jgi:hypothetical protein